MSKIVYEEDIEAAHALAESILGPNGNVIYPVSKDVHLDVKIGTEEHGVLWYGDITQTDIDNKIQLLANKVGAAIWVGR